MQRSALATSSPPGVGEQKGGGKLASASISMRSNQRTFFLTASRTAGIPGMCAGAGRFSPGVSVLKTGQTRHDRRKKAARMKCIVIPAPEQHAETRWDAADIKLRSLEEVNASVIESLSH